MSSFQKKSCKSWSLSYNSSAVVARRNAGVPRGLSCNWNLKEEEQKTFGMAGYIEPY